MKKPTSVAFSNFDLNYERYFFLGVIEIKKKGLIRMWRKSRCSPLGNRITGNPRRRRPSKMSGSKVRKRNPNLVSASRRLLKTRRKKRRHAAGSSKGKLFKIVMFPRSVDSDR